MSSADHDGAPVDVSALVARIKNQRFDGYGPARIADEIDRFRSGAGTGSITGAVDALGEIAAALTETEQTLHTELGKLGISWHGPAAEAAGRAVAEEAGFSSETAATLDGAARALFAQGEAFNRTRDKLPSSAQVRNAVGGTNLGDELMSLIGFETDHAEELARAREATQHAVQVLNEYAAESGDNLGSAETGAEPRTVAFSLAPRSSDGVGRGDGPGGPGAVAPVSGTGPAPGGPATGTTAGVGSSPSASAVPAGTPQGPRAAAFPSGAGADAPTPAAGFAAPATSGGEQDASSATTTAAAAPSAPGATGAGTIPTGSGYGGYGTHGGSGTANGVPGYAGDTRFGAGRAPAAQPGGPSSAAATSETAAGRPGRVVGRVTVPAPGAPAPAGGAANKPYTTLSPLTPSGGAQEATLARGRMSGSVAQPPSGGLPAGASYAARARAAMSATDLGAGAAAIGAGSAAGTLSGDGDTRGRGVGRSAPGAGTSTRQMSFSPGPDAEEAEAVRRAETGISRSPRAGLLEPAAGRDGDGHIRSFGIDHTDVFADERMVAPERIDTGEAGEPDGER